MGDAVRVLVVDDYLEDRLSMGALLTQAGFSVVLAKSAAEAKALLALQPEAIVSDLAMPGEDGFALIPAVRAVQRSTGKRITTIAVTAQAVPESVRRAREEFDFVLPKPIDAPLLVDTLRRRTAPARAVRPSSRRAAGRRPQQHVR